MMCIKSPYLMILLLVATSFLQGCSQDPEKGELPVNFEELSDPIVRDRLLVSIDAVSADAFSRKIFANLDKAKFYLAKVQLDDAPDDEIAFMIKSPYTCDISNTNCTIAFFKEQQGKKELLLMLQGTAVSIQNKVTHGYHDFTVLRAPYKEYWQQMDGEYGLHYDVLRVTPIK